MAHSEFQTDVESCYLTSCENNNALVCALLRIHIGADGICMGYAPITVKETEETEETEETPGTPVELVKGVM